MTLRRLDRFRLETGPWVLLRAARGRLACLAILLLAAAIACRHDSRPPRATTGPAVASAPRRVLLVTVDTLRADHTNLVGYDRETTPKLARWASRGVNFARAIAQWPKTGPSFASIFTGLYPHTTGLIQRAAVRIPAELPVLPELFRAAGYRTVAVQCNPMLSARLGWSRGFDEYLATWGDDGAIPDDPRLFRELWRASRVNALAAPLLARHQGDQRLFVWLHYCDPHAPYSLPQGTDNPFLDDGKHDGGARISDRVAPSTRLDGRTDLAYYVAQYDANLRYVDGQVDEILQQAERLGLLADSMIVFTSDHGESLGEHDSWFEHGPLPYNTTAHVPLFVVAPGLSAGRRVEEPVELLDLLPTLRDLVAPGFDLAGAEGKSLVDLLRGADTSASTTSGRRAFSSAGRRPILFDSVQERRWKLVLRVGGSGGAARTKPGIELYDLFADPLETRNLAPQNTAEVHRLSRLLEGWMSEPRARGKAATADAETRRALRALGYL